MLHSLTGDALTSALTLWIVHRPIASLLEARIEDTHDQEFQHSQTSNAYIMCIIKI